jgi:hypothetical protein
MREYLMSPSLWGLLAGLVGLAGYVPYLRDAWRRMSNPDPAAWLIWAAQYAILLASQVAMHPPRAALVLAALQLAGTAAVLGVLAGRGGWRLTRGRIATLAGTAAAMGVWWFTRSPGLAMCLALAVEGAGMMLVMVNAYRRPGAETIVTWWVFTAAGILDLPALWQQTPRMLYAYPVFFIVMGAGVIAAAAAGGRAAQASAERAGAAQARAAQLARILADGRAGGAPARMRAAMMSAQIERYLAGNR